VHKENKKEAGKRLLALTGQRLNATTAIEEAEEGITNFTLMAYTSQGSSSSSCSDSEYDVQVKDISIKDLKNQLEEALKEKDDLKLKLENFEESSKNLTKLINSQISAKDKTALVCSENDTTSVPETKTSLSKTSKDIVEKPKIVRPSAPIIEE
ncbi:hypothetical protein Tco_0694297, partial [Tanacetum coccineum]